MARSKAGGRKGTSDPQEPGNKLGDIIGDHLGDCKGVEVLEEGDINGGVVWWFITWTESPKLDIYRVISWKEPNWVTAGKPR